LVLKALLYSNYHLTLKHSHRSLFEMINIHYSSWLHCIGRKLITKPWFLSDHRLHKFSAKLQEKERISHFALSQVMGRTLCKALPEVTWIKMSNRFIIMITSSCIPQRSDSFRLWMKSLDRTIRSLLNPYDRFGCFNNVSIGSD
jgi:hypothetical protein